jgi:hypothetical protein
VQEWRSQPLLSSPPCGLQWWRSPQRLLPIPIRLLLFLCSFTFSTTAFFAWQFGSSSCLFGAGQGSWDVAGPPYWVSLMLAGVLLSWTSAATIPAFTLAVHTHTRRVDVSALNASHSGAAWRGSSTVHSNGQQAPAQQPCDVDRQPAAAAAAVPVSDLRAEAERLLARLAHVQACIAAEEQAADALTHRQLSC